MRPRNAQNEGTVRLSKKGTESARPERALDAAARHDHEWLSDSVSALFCIKNSRTLVKKVRILYCTALNVL